MSLTSDEFEACFDRFTRSAFRLETRDRYTVEEENESIASWRRGEPRPEWSVRTSPWLRRIAVTTAGGKTWQRVHAVTLPLGEYVTYELAGYVESQACGEQIRIVDRTELPELPGDVWLFDAGTPGAYAVLMDYDQDGRYLGAELTTDAAALAALSDICAVAWETSVSLNAFLTTHSRGPLGLTA